MKVLIGLPIIFWRHDFVLGWMDFHRELYSQQDIEIKVDIHYRKPVHIAQQKMAERALGEGYDYLLMIDDDIYNPSLEGLKKLIEADKDVIGGAQFASGFPYQLCALKRFDTSKTMMEVRRSKDPRKMYEVTEREGVQPTDLLTLGFTLIKVDFLRRMDRPHFDCNIEYETDFYFCNKCIEMGVTPYVHFDVSLNHRGIFRETKSDAIRNDMLNGTIGKFKEEADRRDGHVLDNVFV